MIPRKTHGWHGCHMDFMRAICIASKINVNDVGHSAVRTFFRLLWIVSKDLDDGELFWIVREKWCNIPACEPESKYLYVSQKRSDDIRCAREIGNGCFFCCFEKGQDAWLTPGQEAGLISPRSLMMKVHRFDIEHPWNRHNSKYITPFQTHPYTHIYIYIHTSVYIYIIISYNFDAMTFAERTYIPTSNAYNHTYSVRPLPPLPVPKNFLPRLRGKARFGVFWSKVGLRWTRRDQ